MMRHWACLIALFLWPAWVSAQTSLEIEQNLAAIGYDVGVIDGHVDRQSTHAVHLFQYNFGFPVSAQLTPQQITFLRNTVALVGVQDPFVIHEPREQTDTLESSFLYGSPVRPDRTIYANGAHYLAERGGHQYNPANSKITSNFTTPALEFAGKRSKQYREAAMARAQASGNALAQAILVLDTYDIDGAGLPETIAALQTILNAAEQSPEETAFISVLAKAARSRTATGAHCRDKLETEELGPLLVRAIELAIRSDLEPTYWGALTVAALSCAPSEARDRIHGLRLHVAQSFSTDAVARIRQEWASEAFESGRSDVAATQYMEVIRLAKERPIDQFFRDEAGFSKLTAWSDILALHALDMTAETDLAAQRLIEVYEASPGLRDEASRVEMGNHHWFQVTTGSVFLELGRFDYLKRQGAKIALNNWQPGRVWIGDTEQGSVWEGAVYSLRTMLKPKKYPDVIRLGGDLLPHVLDTGEWHIAAEVSLLRAEAAVAIGDYATAEPALVNTVTYATNARVSDQLAERVRAVRDALAVFELSQLSPAEIAVEQMRTYYGEGCERGRKDGDTHNASFPAVDLAAITRDPQATATFLRLGAMDMMLACLFDLKEIYVDETRMLCAVAGFVGRKDVSDYIFDPKVQKNEYNYGPEIQTACIHGLALSGQYDWANAHIPSDETGLIADNLRFLTMPAHQRAAALQSMNPGVIENLDIWQIDIKELVINRSPAMREALMKDVRNAFGGSHGNMGPQEEDYYRAYLEAITYQRMGFYNAAEAQLYIDNIVDPLAFGAETEEELTADLLNLPAVAKRLDYAHLYRDQGRFDEAAAAIGPLVELAVSRLSSDDRPLPGTVEQWSTRLRPAFEFYLSLQFDPLSTGPNYPALFLVQQYLQLASSTASLSVLEQRLGSAAPSVAREIQDIQRQIRTELQTPQADLTKLQSLNDQMAVAQSKLSQDDAAFATHQIGVIQNLRDAATTLRDSGATLIFVTQLPEHLIVTKVDGTSAVARKLDRTEVASRNEVSRFRAGILNSSDQKDAFDEALATKIYDDLIGWSFDAEPPDDLRFVIDGPQVTLPLGALQYDGDWLALHSSIRVAPSVARASQNMVRASSASGFVGLGDPDLTSGDTARRAEILGLPNALPELPETASELAFMSLAFGGNPNDDVFVEDAATEATVAALNASDRLSTAGILAMSTHGLLSAETGQLSEAALVLSVPSDASEDGLLTASEIYGLRIGADLVILSACNTGTPNAEVGLSELSSAFLYAGSKGLLLTHWEIDSGAGVEIVKRFATGFRSREDAQMPMLLKDALTALLKDETAARFHHPRFWASHFIIG